LRLDLTGICIVCSLCLKLVILLYKVLKYGFFFYTQTDRLTSSEGLY